jgi:serine/threonine protein kinase
MDKTGKPSGTVERFGTWDYDPPEVWASLQKGRSRFVDIWAFGCVLVESVIWILFGEDALQIFLNDQSRGTGSLYWSIDNIVTRQAKINEATFEWINRLLDNGSECKVCEGGSAIRDLIQLIRDKLLVIEHPDEYDKRRKERE